MPINKVCFITGNETINKLINCMNEKPSCYIENSGASLVYISRNRTNYEFIIEVLRYSNDKKVFVYIKDTGKDYEIKVITKVGNHYDEILSSDTKDLNKFFNEEIRKDNKATELIVVMSVGDKIIDLIKKSIFFDKLNENRIYKVDALIIRDTVKVLSCSFKNNQNIRMSLQVDYDECSFRMILLGSENKHLFGCNIGRIDSIDYNDFISVLEENKKSIQNLNVDYQYRENAIETLNMLSLSSIRNNISEDIIKYNNL